MMKKKRKSIAINLAVAFFSFVVIFMLPAEVFAAPTSQVPVGDIETSVNTAAEGGYDFIKNIAFWVGTVLVALGFLLLKFKFLDRSGKGSSLILWVLFAVGGIFAAPQIVQWVIDLVS
ncbi:TrbC/VirB2 family protein [Listeria booriae]|uniref:TrbC/VirB2 family protein n=1 Tax=Listeria booriae TaxID=1552123 RepID=UPI002E7ABB59|nr:TrbC/VirB2 family protein [Listeria booriae]